MMRFAPLVAALGVVAVLMAACGGGEGEELTPTAEVALTAGDCEFARTLRAQFQDFDITGSPLGELLREQKLDDPGWRNNVSSQVATLKAMCDDTDAIELPPHLDWVLGDWRAGCYNLDEVYELAEAIDAQDVSKMKDAATMVWVNALFTDYFAAQYGRRNIEAQLASCP